MSRHPGRGKRRSPWPKQIEQWLLYFAADPTLRKRDRERLDRLTYDSRLEGMAAKLFTVRHKDAPFEDATPLFLEHALSLAGIAERLAREGDFRKKEISELSEAVGDFQRAVARHSALIALYLAGDEPLGSGFARHEELRKTIQTISDSAGAGVYFPGFDEYIAPARKGQEHTYFVRKLGEYAEEMFDDPLDEEVGILAGVCFDREELSPAEVQAIRARRMKVNSKSKKK